MVCGAEAAGYTSRQTFRPTVGPVFTEGPEAGNGAAADDGPLVAALYLLERGLRFVADGQAVAGARKGPVEAWLRPGLEALVEGLRSRAGTVLGTQQQRARATLGIFCNAIIV